jgi:hypothetical protein
LNSLRYRPIHNIRYNGFMLRHESRAIIGHRACHEYHANGLGFGCRGYCRLRESRRRRESSLFRLRQQELTTLSTEFTESPSLISFTDDTFQGNFCAKYSSAYPFGGLA